MRHAMIMAGGAGTRLWPMSRRDRPKQLLPLIHGQSLLAVAVERVASLVPEPRRWICTNEDFRAPIRETLSFPDDRILGEPVARDTLNAVGFAAAIIAREEPDAVMAVLTADHIIRPVDRFADCIRRGFEAVESNPEALITFSIVPTYPATIYGYIERGEAVGSAFEARRYVEKPDEETATRYLETGRFGWSSGMFVFRAQTMLDAIARFKPEAFEGIREIAAAWGTADQTATLQRVYPTLPKISIDFAIMEPASEDPDAQVLTIPMEVEWIDVGSWPHLAETLDPDDAGNRVAGQAHLLETSRTLVFNDTPDHLVAAFGCDDLIIVHTADVTLVCPADRSKDLKSLVERVDDSLR